ncbi:MAG: hypothetical protein HYT38_01220 [Candidatus Sungbacteria bacterium]|uniref:Uncharacterized protein n=1 Tax=Candidatus Sungiibacteriota bacterium TaxID=2750080 RepID=A0A9D6DQ89_9BACT|nr:hypothetical protein [Candidatus Sungbacteria bacterium]
MDAILSIGGGVLAMGVVLLVALWFLPKCVVPRGLKASGWVGNHTALTPRIHPRTQPEPKRAGWQVRFAGDWHDCQVIGDNGDAGKLIRVHLPDGRFHQTTRPLIDIRRV